MRNFLIAACVISVTKDLCCAYIDRDDSRTSAIRVSQAMVMAVTAVGIYLV